MFSVSVAWCAGGGCLGEGYVCCNSVCIYRSSCVGLYCSSFDGCSSRETCCNSICVNGTDCIGRGCTLESDCASSEVCCSGTCKAGYGCIGLSCKTNDDCSSPYEYCCGGTCSYNVDCDFAFWIVLSSVLGGLFVIFILFMLAVCFCWRRRRYHGRVLEGQRLPSVTSVRESSLYPYLPSYQQGYPYYPPPQYVQYPPHNVDLAKSSGAPPPYSGLRFLTSVWKTVKKLNVFEVLGLSLESPIDCTRKSHLKSKTVQNFACRIVSGRRKYDHMSSTLKELLWLPVKEHLYYRDAVMSFKCLTGCAPGYLSTQFIRRVNVNLTTLVATINVSSALLVSDGVALLSQTVAAGKVVAATYVDMAATARGPPVIPTTIVAMVGKVVAAIALDLGRVMVGQRVTTTTTIRSATQSSSPYPRENPPAYQQGYPYLPPPQYEQHQTNRPPPYNPEPSTASEQPPPYTGGPHGVSSRIYTPQPSYGSVQLPPPV
ncbi:hypothetical protein AWC38_SpisGene1728 [Stylophora pistillata]|uniref:Uncharacterized protein n=1 Tax=Stylophora pistillata TaxID=50429 RepID=A0A2B4SYF9_STYPI|nr:hypothetical protein AWC38_SpisGene1728 [Stylophora pistillata]